MLRLRATPFRPQTILIALVVVYWSITLLGTLLLLIAGKLVYGLRFEGSPFDFVRELEYLQTSAFAS